MNKCSASPRWIFSALGILGLALALTAVSPVSAQNETEAKAATTSNTADLPPLPLSPIEKAQRDGTAVPLSLKDVTKLALQNNLTIAIQDTNELASQEKIKQVYGDYDPKLTAQLSVNSRKNANTNLSQASTGSFTKMDTAQWNFTFSQPIKTGGSIDASWNSQRSDNNTTFSLFTPQYSSSMTVTFNQPLWRNFRIDSTRANIKVYNLDLKNTDSVFKQRVTETISNIQSQYWDLVRAIENYEIRRNSVRLVQVTLRDNRRKVEVGTAAPIQVTDAEANVASREVELIEAEETILSQENALRALISSDRKSEIWSQVIVPTDKPDFKAYAVELETAINTALVNRPELEQSDISLRKLDINKKLTENNRKWQFDLQASFGSNGTAGPQSVTRSPLTGVLSNSIPPALVGGIGNAYKTIFTEGFTNWSVGFQVQIPVRHRSIDAQLAQQNIQRQQELMKRRQTEQDIQVDVRNAVQQLETRRKQVETAGVAKRLAKERLDGEEKRFQAGLSENYLVLQRQNELATQEYQELSAKINYKKSILNLQKALYTLIESSDFEIAKGSSTNIAPLK